MRHQEDLAVLQQNNITGDAWVAIAEIPEHYLPDVNIIATSTDRGFDCDATLPQELYLI